MGDGANSTLPRQARFRTATRTLIVILGASAAVAGCDSSDPVVHTNLRIYSSPYSGVNWANDFRLKSQHHDHVGTSVERIRAYDAAGYAALSLMDYSGNRALPYALTRRLWPPESELPASLLSSLSNIKVFIPNAEEVGDLRQHATSPFLTTYIEGWTPDSGVAKQSWHYSSVQEMFEVIRREGGLPCLAHPWEAQDYRQYSGVFCVEIYSAFAAARRHEGVADFVAVDRNRVLLDNWDYALARNQTILGIAVNDHFGPLAVALPETIRDSGKIIVLAKAPTLEAYEEAMRRGAFFAVRDVGAPKDQYPVVHDIAEDTASISIQATGSVLWVTGGAVAAAGNTLRFTDLPPNSRYVRAEIAGTNDSVVYTQAFSVRPVGDIDGDYDVDGHDAEICNAVPEASEKVLVAACAATMR